MAGITNTTRGPRFVYANGEPTLIEAGETKDLPLRDAEIANVQHQVDAGMLAWDGEAPTVDEPVASDISAADLLAKVDSLHFKTFQAAASKILGPDAPTTKAELIAALQAKAAG